MNTKQFGFLALTLTILAACGKDGGGSDSKSAGQASPPRPQIEEQASEGNYRAILRPINNSLSGFLPSGFAEINIAGDSVEVKTLLDDDARVPHMQFIHAGTECPTMKVDKNKDGLIDPKELTDMAGPVLIPLDGDLNASELGSEEYPVGRGFTYVETASLANLEKDVKSRMKQNLNLSGRVIILHGVDNNTKMPEEFATIKGASPQASAPIACGIIQRLK